MGRYYSGDIEGKFWVGVQESNDASFFGGNENDPSYIEYYFSNDDLPDIKKGIAKCKKHLGENREKLETFFAENNSYSYAQLSECLGIGNDENDYNGFTIPAVQEVLTWYARLELGKKILKCVEEKGECNFDAGL